MNPRIAKAVVLALNEGLDRIGGVMKHRASEEDDRFRNAFESQQIEPAAFDHAAHVRLAYVYLCENSVDGAVAKMKGSLLAFLTHLGADVSKYHETITRAWVMPWIIS